MTNAQISWKRFDMEVEEPEMEPMTDVPDFKRSNAGARDINEIACEAIPGPFTCQPRQESQTRSRRSNNRRIIQLVRL